jgi:hypothetical protein
MKERRGVLQGGACGEENLFLEFRFAARMLRKSPGFASSLFVRNQRFDVHRKCGRSE